MKALLLSACICIAAVAHGASAQDVAPRGETPEMSVRDTGKPINALCPVTGDEPIDPRFTAEYKGQIIGLCCRKCVTKFQNDPESYIANLPIPEPASFEVQPSPDVSIESEPASHIEQDQEADHDHDEAGDGDHDHEADHDQSGSRVLALLGKLHPPATHLPIGMLIGAALAELGLMVTGREIFRQSVGFCVGLAAAGAVAAATLGWINGGFVLVDDDWVQTTHRWLGTSTAVLSVLTLAMLLSLSRDSDSPGSRTAFRIVLFLASGVVGATGFFGGALVYGLNHYAI